MLRKHDFCMLKPENHVFYEFIELGQKIVFSHHLRVSYWCNRKNNLKFGPLDLKLVGVDILLNI